MLKMLSLMLFDWDFGHLIYQLLNPYGFIPVNPDRHSHVKYNTILRFGGFITSEFGQSLIGAFRKNNAILFHPCYGFCNETHKCPTTDEEINFWTPYQSEFAGLTL